MDICLFTAFSIRLDLNLDHRIILSYLTCRAARVYKRVCTFKQNLMIPSESARARAGTTVSLQLHSNSRNTSTSEKCVCTAQANPADHWNHNPTAFRPEDRRNWRHCGTRHRRSGSLKALRMSWTAVPDAVGFPLGDREISASFSSNFSHHIQHRTARFATGKHGINRS